MADTNELMQQIVKDCGAQAIATLRNFSIEQKILNPGQYMESKEAADKSTSYAVDNGDGIILGFSSSDTMSLSPYGIALGQTLGAIGTESFQTCVKAGGVGR